MSFKTKVKLLSSLMLIFIAISTFLVFEVRDNLFSRRNFWNIFAHTSNVAQAETKVLVPMGINHNQKFQLRKIKIESTKMKDHLNNHSDAHLGTLIQDSIKRKNNIKRPELTTAFVNEQIKKVLEEKKKKQEVSFTAPKRMKEAEIAEMLSRKNLKLEGKLNKEPAEQVQPKAEEISMDEIKKYLPTEAYEKLMADGKNMSHRESEDFIFNNLPNEQKNKFAEINIRKKKLSMEEIDTILKEKLPPKIYEDFLKSYQNPSSGLLASHEMKYILRQYLPKNTYKAILFSLRTHGGKLSSQEEIDYLKKNNIPIQSAELDEDHL